MATYLAREGKMDKIWLKSYADDVPKSIDITRYTSIVDMFERCCEKYRTSPAVRNFGTGLTYEQLYEVSGDFASYLQNCLGLRKGDRIALILPNTLQYYVALFGALRAGLIIVNVNPLYTKHELEHQLSDAGAETVVVLENFAHTLELALPNLRVKNIVVSGLGDLLGFPKGKIVNFAVKYLKGLVPSYHLPKAVFFNDAIKKGKERPLQPVALKGSDLAFLQYTGGTTGVAKGAELTHSNIVINVLQIIAMSGKHLGRQCEVCISPLPLYHIFALTISCFVMMELGAESVLITNPKDIPHFIKELKHTKFTLMVSINTLCNALLNNPEFNKIDFSRLRYCFVGGMATNRAVAEKWKQVTGSHLQEGYGLTETSPVVTLNRLDITDFTGSIGLPIVMTDVDVKDDEGNSVPLGEVGELCVKGPQVMEKYWKNPEETKNSFTTDGYFRTGDLVTMDEKGFIYIVDRKKDMIDVSGFKVYPNEVEEVLMKHPSVQEAAVVGVPDEAHGELVKALIVRNNPKLTEENVIFHCKEFLTPYKVPHIVEFRDELPKSPVGKILRRKLR